jgi:hypothetical protein
VGVARIEASEMIATVYFRPLSQLALPVGLAAMSSGKGTVAETQERKKRGKSVALRGKKGKLVRMDDKKLAEESVPIGTAILIAGTTSTLSR